MVRQNILIIKYFFLVNFFFYFSYVFYTFNKIIYDIFKNNMRIEVSVDYLDLQPASIVIFSSKYFSNLDITLIHSYFAHINPNIGLDGFNYFTEESCRRIHASNQSKYLRSVHLLLIHYCLQ